MRLNLTEYLVNTLNELRTPPNGDKSVAESVTAQIRHNLVTVPEAADLLGVSTRKVTRMAHNGQIPCIKLSLRTLRFDRKALEPFMGRSKELNRLPYSSGPAFRYHRSQRHRCTADLFAEMVESQNGRCVICNAKPPRLFVDHDHSTGFIRGLLCHPCNAGIGMFHDSERLMRRAIAYLRAHRIPHS